MPSRTTENIKYIDQGNFSIWQNNFEDIKYNRCYNHVAYSILYGRLFLAHENEVKVLPLLSLEPSFEGENEVSLPEDVEIQTLTMIDNILSLSLSPNNEYLTICSEKTIYVYSVHTMRSEVNLTLLNIECNISITCIFSI
jgi:hypothetical protein